MKPKHRIALEQRAVNALQGLYHNATLPWGDFADTPEETAEWIGADAHQILFDWLGDEANREMEYIQGGGAYGLNFAKTLSADCNAGRYSSRRARIYYINRGMQQMRMDRAKGGRWERILEYGTVYQWGRGGRTVAPVDLIRQGGGSAFGIAEHITEDMNTESLTDLCLTVEAFNAFVGSVCEGFAERWREYLADCQEQLADERHSSQIIAARELEETRPDMYARA